MDNMSIRQLAKSLGSSPCFGPMPPVGGDAEPIRRIVTRTEDVGPRDVLLGISQQSGAKNEFWEEAYSRGALGVIAERRLAPWPGCFAIQVDSVNQVLEWIKQQDL